MADPFVGFFTKQTAFGMPQRSGNLIKEGKIVGNSLLTLNYDFLKDKQKDGVGFIDWVGVEKEYQGSGYGTILLKRTLEDAAVNGLKKVYLKVMGVGDGNFEIGGMGAHNKLVKFYQKHGAKLDETIYEKKPHPVYNAEYASTMHFSLPRPVKSAFEEGLLGPWGRREQTLQTGMEKLKEKYRDRPY